MKTYKKDLRFLLAQTRKEMSQTSYKSEIKIVEKGIRYAWANIWFSNLKLHDFFSSTRLC